MNRAGLALLVRELRARRRALSLIALWSAIESLPSLLSGLLVSAALGRFLAHEALSGTAFLALLLGSALVAAIATRQLFPHLAAVVEPVRDALVTAVVEGAVTSATGSQQRADTAQVARVTEQVQAVRDLLGSLLRMARQILFTALAALAGLWLLAPSVALVTGVLVTVSLTVFALLLPGLAARRRKVLLAEEEVARTAGTVFGGIRDAIACAGEAEATRAVGTAIDGSLGHSRVLARAMAVRSLIVFLGGQLPLVVLLASAPSLVHAGRLTPGEVIGAATYLTVGLEPALRELVGTGGSLCVELAVTLDRLGEGFTDRRPQTQAVGEQLATQRCDLVATGLTFAYGPHAAPIVDALDLTLTEGRHLAVVGPSGIGKSTLASLLGGLLAPQRGTVSLGGTDIRQIRESELRRLLSIIPQEAYVFAGTLRDNLGYLAPYVTDRELTGAAADTGLALLAERLGGLDALIGAGGAELSQGERQLVALTRVYVSPARIVILDEATSNLDPAAEATVEAAFARRPGTLVVIAHRISSARRAEHILVLDGDKAQLGTHDELVRTSTLYANLVGHWGFANPPPSEPTNPPVKRP
ncbi:ABC transporter ATP-binding protein [Streptomyces sp. NPDC020719]|uniref:ABC transporter ATP-binding protein n=1 Tax=Streptomyces sp. NPDC020719 TaxID=3154896 RepID=UPI0033EB1BD5